MGLQKNDILGRYKKVDFFICGRVSSDSCTSRDFFFSVFYAFLILAQRVVHGRITRFNQSVINDVFNTRFKRFNFFRELYVLNKNFLFDINNGNKLL
jgi:hypothetical protein